MGPVLCRLDVEPGAPRLAWLHLKAVVGSHAQAVDDDRIRSELCITHVLRACSRFQVLQTSWCQVNIIQLFEPSDWKSRTFLNCGRSKLV